MWFLSFLARFLEDAGEKLTHTQSVPPFGRGEDRGLPRYQPAGSSFSKYIAKLKLWSLSSSSRPFLVKKTASSMASMAPVTFNYETRAHMGRIATW